MAITATLTPTGVEDLDPAAVLAGASEAETAERRAGLAKLELALQWCVLHPATTESGAAVWGDAGLPGLSDWEESLGGEGCPTVAAYAPEPFAAALGVATFTGMQVLADALDLAHRLPLTWRRVQALAVAPWKARRLAQATHQLSRAAAGYVDAQMADRIDSCGAVLIDRTVAHAAATYDPQSRAETEQAGQQSWDVRLLHRTDGDWAGTSHLDATGDTVDLTKFYDLVCDHAAHLARLGDTDDLGIRKAKALGAIADHQAQLDLFGSSRDQDVAVRRPSLAKTRLYLHLTLTDLLGLPDGLVAAGEVERLGPVTTAKIKEWLGSTRATIVPVLHMGTDPAAEKSVDQHDPPDDMRETVILRDRHCVFPWCTVDARACDIDHIEPYVAPDDGGPPGQTAPSKLACLCRRHHNAKTSRRWSYVRERDGTCTWHGPYGLAYLVTPTAQHHSRAPEWRRHAPVSR
jgi:hypothetical protein